MAFENVFGNVDFRLPVAAQQQQQQTLMNMLGRVVEQKNFERQMDLRERQLNQKTEDFDLSKSAQKELLKMRAGMPYDENIIRAYSDFKGSQTYVDPFSQRVITNPSLADRVGLGGGFVAGRPTNNPNYSGARPSDNAGYLPPDINEAQGDAYLNNLMLQQGKRPAPAMPVMIPEDMGAPDAQMRDFNSLMVDVSAAPYQAQGALAGTPRGAIMEAESAQNLKEYASKKGIDLSLLGQEKKIELMAQFDYEKRLSKFKSELEMDAEERKKLPGRQTFERELAKVLEALNALEKQGGTVSERQSSMKNLGAIAAETPVVGRVVQGTFDPGTQRLRDIIEGKRPILFNAIKKASGLTGTELNSQFEVENQLKQLGNPLMEVEARRSLLQDLSRTFGTGEISSQAKGTQKSRKRYNPQTGRLE